MNISINVINLVISYLIIILSSIIMALILKLPLMPEKPIRNSWTSSALFPTPIIAVGFLAIVNQFNIKGFFNGYDIALVLGVFSAIFVKYIMDLIFPKPSNVLEDEK